MFILCFFFLNGILVFTSGGGNRALSGRATGGETIHRSLRSGAQTSRMSDGSIRTYYSFPSPEELASASLDDLLTLKLGYRAKYIHRLIQDVLAGTVSLESLAALPPDEAMTTLTSLYGIGPKVANCVCLFGLHHIDAFPVDTWIEQILTKEYLPKHPIRYRRLPKSRLYTTIIQDFFGSYKGYAGVMQQYIFYYERSIRNGKS